MRMEVECDRFGFVRSLTRQMSHDNVGWRTHFAEVSASGQSTLCSKPPLSKARPEHAWGAKPTAGWRSSYRSFRGTRGKILSRGRLLTGSAGASPAPTGRRRFPVKRHVKQKADERVIGLKNSIRQDVANAGEAPALPVRSLEPSRALTKSSLLNARVRFDEGHDLVHVAEAQCTKGVCGAIVDR